MEFEQISCGQARKATPCQAAHLSCVKEQYHAVIFINFQI